MTWTTDKPSKPGWYWWRDNEDATILIVHIHHIGKQSPLFVEHFGWLNDEIMDDGEWAGPLEPPEEGT